MSVFNKLFLFGCSVASALDNRDCQRKYQGLGVMIPLTSSFLSVTDQKKIEQLSIPVGGSPDRSSPSEEFPWCVICNEDADFRSSLTGDLYCQVCVRECHDEEEVREHKFHRFSAKR